LLTTEDEILKNQQTEKAAEIIPPSLYMLISLSNTQIQFHQLFPYQAFCWMPNQSRLTYQQQID